eukprot:scaffold464_cov181-Amphora_coffeaeformis.AAC.7
MKRRHSSGSLRGRMEEQGSDDVPIDIQTSGEDYLEETSLTDDYAEEEVVTEQHRDSMDANTMTDDESVARQAPTTSTAPVLVGCPNEDAANCQRSRSVQLPDGSIRTRVRTRTHHHLHASNIFWHNSCSCERSHTVRLADGSMRIRTRTRTLRTTTQNDSSSFWSGENNHAAASLESIHRSDSTAVRFGEIRVREYERIPDSTLIFMGLSLGWTWFQETTQAVPATDEEHQQEKQQITAGSEAPPKEENTKMKRTNGNERYGMLVRYGYGPRELKQATKEAHTFYKQRQREAARPLVVAEHRKQQHSPNDRPLLRSSFG